MSVTRVCRSHDTPIGGKKWPQDRWPRWEDSSDERRGEGMGDRETQWERGREPTHECREECLITPEVKIVCLRSYMFKICINIVTFVESNVRHNFVRVRPAHDEHQTEL